MGSQGTVTNGRHGAAAAPVPALLCNADYYGTLAAARSLGRAGVPVTTVDPSSFKQTRYSRFVNAHLACPPFEDTEGWVEWLLRVGRSGPKRAIYATSDDVSFAIALHRDALASSFYLYQPPLETMMCVLDKGQLLDHARAVGIDVPNTWLPQSRADVERLARDADRPLLIKPRTQVSTKNHLRTKGTVCQPGSRALVAEYDRFIRQSRHESEFAKLFPEATQPLIQTYHPEAMNAIYSLAGFRDESGCHVALLGANKVLQRPRRLGIGLCFEGAPVDPDLAARVARLCERIGYYGVFEVEFIPHEGRSLLIDLNARFYNQMLFDIARGMDLARMAYAGATGDCAELARLVAAVPTTELETNGPRMAFCNRVGFEVTIGMQRIFGAMSKEDAKNWREWRTDPSRTVVDAVAAADDPLPLACDIAQQTWQMVRHPRSFVRQLGLG